MLSLYSGSGEVLVEDTEEGGLRVHVYDAHGHSVAQIDHRMKRALAEWMEAKSTQAKIRAEGDAHRHRGDATRTAS